MDSYGWTALHYSVYSGQMEKIELLVGAKANIWIRSTAEQWWGTLVVPRGSTPLDIARIMQQSANNDSQQKQFGEIVEYLSALQKAPAKK
jgi:ankyrin repeat protein